MKLINLLENDTDQMNDNELPTRVNYVGQIEIDRSMLYSFNGSFQLLRADVANREFLGKFVSVPNYVLLIVDLYSSKAYLYPMRSRKQILEKLEQFYIDVNNKRKNKSARLPVDNNFNRLR